MFKHITTLSCLLEPLTTTSCAKQLAETYLVTDIKATDTPLTMDNNSNDGSKLITKPVVPDLSTCQVEDNYNDSLGDIDEFMLAKALHHLKTGNWLSANNILDRLVTFSHSTFIQYFSSSSYL